MWNTGDSAVETFFFEQKCNRNVCELLVPLFFIKKLICFVLSQRTKFIKNITISILPNISTIKIYSTWIYETNWYLYPWIFDISDGWKHHFPKWFRLFNVSFSPGRVLPSCHLVPPVNLECRSPWPLRLPFLPHTSSLCLSILHSDFRRGQRPQPCIHVNHADLKKRRIHVVSFYSKITSRFFPFPSSE